jgi:DNA-binding response OmpR family regulator
MTRVLVIEDEPRIASFLARALRAEGFDVDEVGDGVNGLERASSGLYDLVVLDLLRPGLDGKAVLERLIQTRPEQRVLVLSALGDVENRVRCFELGAVDYMQKPFALAELVARVRARLRHPSVPRYDRHLVVGSVSLDLLTRSVDRGDRSIPLSQREFLLLQTLMRHKDDVLSRERLLSEVWGLSFDPGSNVVEVFIRRLRSKLGPEVIQTVRGVGYRLAA